MNLNTTAKPLVWVVVGAFFLLLVLGIPNMGFSIDLLKMALIYSIFTLLPSLWFFYKAYFMNKERKLIFDRQRGLIQVPGSYNEPPQLLRFSEAHFVIAMLTRLQGGVFLFLCKNKTFADKYLGQSIMTPFFQERFGNHGAL